jgi:hypothetical protein
MTHEAPGDPRGLLGYDRRMTKQLERYEELLYEISHDLRHGDHKSAARVVEDIPPEQLRDFTLYLAEALHGRKLII